MRVIGSCDWCTARCRWRRTPRCRVKGRRFSAERCYAQIAQPQSGQLASALVADKRRLCHARKTGGCYCAGQERGLRAAKRGGGSEGWHAGGAVRPQRGSDVRCEARTRGCDY